MLNRRTKLITLSVIMILGAYLSACQRARVTEIPSPTVTVSPTVSEIIIATATSSEYPYPPANTPVFVTITAPAYPAPGTVSSATPTTPATTQAPQQNITATISQPSPTPESPTPEATQQQAIASETSVPTLPTATNTVVSQYPGPGYPGPFMTHTPLPRPATATHTPVPTATKAVTGTPIATQKTTVEPSITPFPTFTPGTPGVVPTELPPRPPISPPPPGSSVTIWHSWNSAETAELQAIIQAFQKIYPDVTFSLQHVPLNALYASYEEAAYTGGGPSLLLGPAEWGPGLFDEELVTDLNPYVPPNYLSSISPAALTSGEYRQSLISLPLSQRGMVMFRNTLILKSAPITFTDLDSLSHEVTHGGLVGSYLERGSQFSSADIIGLGGMVMDEAGNPAFNSEFGLEWLELLADYDTAGAVTFNTNWDLDMFRRGRVGTIIDGTWNIPYFSQILGAGNLAIDPWPTFGTGHLAGWVEADSVFLNSNITGNNRFAALSFMGYLLDPNVQMHLAEVGHIPSVVTTQPRDPLIRQAMEAFVNACAYPVGVDASVITLYQKELDNAITSVFVNGVSPGEALKTASDNITSQMKNMTAEP